jgi:RNA-directed DNA polymerase
MHIPKRSRSIVSWTRYGSEPNEPLKTKELIAGLNPLLRGWGEYYKRAHVRRLSHRQDAWIRRRIWSHRYKHWRNAGWTQLPLPKLYGDYGLVRLLDLIPSLSSRRR